MIKLATIDNGFGEVYDPAKCSPEMARALLPEYEALDAQLRERDATLIERWPAARGLVDEIGEVSGIIHFLRQRAGL